MPTRAWSPRTGQVRRRRPSPRRTGSAGDARGLLFEDTREALQACCTRTQQRSWSAQAHMHDRPVSCLCLTVSHRPSRHAGRMALQKLLMLSYEQRSPSASRRASWTTTVSRTTGSERHFALPVHACRYGPCGCFGEARGEAVCGAHDVWSSVGSRWIHQG